MSAPRDLRIAALRRFGTAITFLNVIGRLVLGIEPSWLQMIVAALTAYAVELTLEFLGAWSERRPLQLALDRPASVLDFLLPAHITAMACSMLTYANDRLAVVAFAVAVGITSKALLRVRSGTSTRHFLNPSNTGIAITLLLFPWVGVAQPYQFTERISGAWDWIVPGIVTCLGTLLNAKFTKRLPLIGAWLSVFALQAAARSVFFETPFWAALVPMTGLAFLLFTFYMITDPATTPFEPRRQMLFGASVALVYGLLQVVHVVFGLFFALFVVCSVRGVVVWVKSRQPSVVPAPAVEAQPAELVVSPGE